MKILFLIVGLFAFIHQFSNAQAQKPCPPELIKQADKAFGEMVLYGNRHISWPRTVQDLSNLCG
jgi:hypothetical protein